MIEIGELLGSDKTGAPGRKSPKGIYDYGE
jgi:hypothetical protein